MTILHLTNASPVTFGGWLRTNVDVLPPHPQGSTPEGNYMLGLQSGLDTHNLDIYCALGPGESKVIDLSAATPMSYFPHAGFMPNSPGMWGGIAVSVANVPLQFLGSVINGAAFDGHWRGRIGAMLNVDLHVHWYPDDPAWCPAELIICASNPAVQDIKQFIPDGFVMRFGDAEVMVPGLLSWDLMEEGDWLADAQARILGGIVLCWERHGANRDMARAIADQQIQCLGIAKLHADGNPHLPANFDAAKWAKDMLPQVIAAQHNWFSSPLDPAMVSGATGAQGSQSFVGGPAMADASAVGAFYIGALDGSWPMFHLEESGEQLDWKAHPNLRLHYGRVNRQLNAGDTLGKDSEPSSADSHGYRGPEDEHWFDWVLLAGARLKGTPATQWHLRMHAIQCLFRYVVTPPGIWLTANRGIGWLSFLAVELYRGLADRELAEAVKARWVALFHQLIAPRFAAGPFGWSTDPRIGGTEQNPHAVPWQDSVAALGIDWAGFAFLVPEAWDLAANMAVEIIDKAYEKQPDGKWRSKPIISKDGSPVNYALYGVSLGYYDSFGMPMAVAAVLKHNPGHPRAREIWAQLKAESTTWAQASWLAPGIEVTP